MANRSFILPCRSVFSVVERSLIGFRRFLNHGRHGPTRKNCRTDGSLRGATSRHAGARMNFQQFLGQERWGVLSPARTDVMFRDSGFRWRVRAESVMHLLFDRASSHL